MNILVIGGTRFVGRAMTQSLIDAGHKVTLFHRGKTNPDIFPEAEHIIGDRPKDLSGLKGRQWDAVLDPSAYFPRAVRSLLEVIGSSVKQYVFISTISVYAQTATPGINEDSALAELNDPTTEEITGETYGGLKVLCERELEKGFAGDVLIIRPGFVVGPEDYTMRWPYWLNRVAKGGPMVIPGPANLPTQFIDARDLAAFTREGIESRRSGVFNVTGPQTPLSWMEVVETAREISGSDAQFFEIDLEKDLPEEPPAEGDPQPVFNPLHFPMVAPGPEGRAMMQVDISAALRAGLQRRPLSDTVRDTLAWISSAKPDFSAAPGLPADREAELLGQFGSFDEEAPADRN